MPISTLPALLIPPEMHLCPAVQIPPPISWAKGHFLSEV